MSKTRRNRVHHGQVRDSGAFNQVFNLHRPRLDRDVTRVLQGGGGCDLLGAVHGVHLLLLLERIHGDGEDNRGAGAYTRPLSGLTLALLVRNVGWSEWVAVKEMAQVELRSGQVENPAVAPGCTVLKPASPYARAGKIFIGCRLIK